MESNKPQLLNIMGTGRNGSTLLMRLLEGSPDLWVYPIELNYMRLFGKGRKKPWIEKIRKRIFGSEFEEYMWIKFIAQQTRELEETYLNKLEEPYEPTGSALDYYFKNSQEHNEHDLIKFMKSFQRSYDVRMHEKPPILAFKCTDVDNAERYVTEFSDMKFLHIIRDPISNWASLKRTDMVLKSKPFWYQGGDIFKEQIEKRWMAHARFAAGVSKIKPEKHLMIRYEDLCNDPVNTIESITNWADISKPEMIDIQTVLGGKVSKEFPISSSQKNVGAPSRIVTNMAGEYKYESVVEEREEEFIVYRTEIYSKEFGYRHNRSSKKSKINLMIKWLFIDEWETKNIKSLIDWLRWPISIVNRRIYILTKIINNN